MATPMEPYFGRCIHLDRRGFGCESLRTHSLNCTDWMHFHTSNWQPYSIIHKQDWWIPRICGSRASLFREILIATRMEVRHIASLWWHMREILKNATLEKAMTDHMKGRDIRYGFMAYGQLGVFLNPAVLDARNWPDCVTPFVETTHMTVTLCVPMLEEESSLLRLIVAIFDRYVWLLILISLLAISIFDWIFCSVHFRSHSPYRSSFDTLINQFSLLIGQGSAQFGSTVPILKAQSDRFHGQVAKDARSQLPVYAVWILSGSVLSWCLSGSLYRIYISEPSQILVDSPFDLAVRPDLTPIWPPWADAMNQLVNSGRLLLPAPFKPLLWNEWNEKAQLFENNTSFRRKHVIVTEERSQGTMQARLSMSGIETYVGREPFNWAPVGLELSLRTPATFRNKAFFIIEKLRESGIFDKFREQSTRHGRRHVDSAHMTDQFKQLQLYNVREIFQDMMKIMGVGLVGLIFPLEYWTRSKWRPSWITF